MSLLVTDINITMYCYTTRNTINTTTICNTTSTTIMTNNNNYTMTNKPQDLFFSTSQLYGCFAIVT